MFGRLIDKLERPFFGVFLAFIAGCVLYAIYVAFTS